MGNQIVFAATAAVSVSKVLYTGRVHVTGGREGAAKSSDGRLDINLSSPGTSGLGTNPEQLFAAGWSACFLGAMQINASTLKIKLPAETSVDTEVDLATGDEGYALQARLRVNLPGLSQDDAAQVVQAAHQTCPYSKATKGNISVEIMVAV
jgi:Ohr subfamily peroxiredoxin